MQLRNLILAEIRRHRGHDDLLAIPRPFIELTGTLRAAALLSQLLYWTDRATLPNGWVYKTRAEWVQEVGGTCYALDTARRRLRDLGLTTETVKLIGHRPTLHMRLDVPRLLELLHALLAADGLSNPEAVPGDDPAASGAPSPRANSTPPRFNPGAVEPPLAAMPRRKRGNRRASTRRSALRPARLHPPPDHVEHSPRSDTGAGLPASKDYVNRHIDRLLSRAAESAQVPPGPARSPAAYRAPPGDSPAATP